MTTPPRPADQILADLILSIIDQRKGSDSPAEQLNAIEAKAKRCGLELKALRSALRKRANWTVGILDSDSDEGLPCA